MNRSHYALAIGLTAVTWSTAVAHPGHAFPADLLSHTAFLSGWLHPWFGLDHLLAIVTVGILGVQFGGRSILGLPGSFLVMMVVGCLLGISGVAAPQVETGIGISIVLLGAAVAVGRKYPLAIASVAIGVCGLLHGHSHGTEMSVLTAPEMYVAGFVAASVVLHAIGILAGFAMTYRQPRAVLLRMSGAAIALAGILLFAGVL